MLPSAIRLSRSSTIGWIGLGAMGHPMALNLFTKTHLAQSSPGPGTGSGLRYLICEQDDRRAAEFVEEAKQRGGAELASRIERVSTGREMANHASRIITMLPSTPQVESVYLNPNAGILQGLKDLPGDTPALASLSPTESQVPNSDSGPGQGPGLEQDTYPGEQVPHTMLIDQTTLDPTFAMQLAERVTSETVGRGVMLDAPVSGGTTAARAGTLTIMFGSPSPFATSHAVPLLQTMAREGGVVACGKNGTGVGVKVCNNLILAINQIALAEGLALGKNLGIDPVLLHSVINTSSGASWSSRVNSPSPEIPNSPGERGYAGGFQSRLMLKDVGLALHAAHAYDLPTPLTWAAKSVYDAVCEEEGGELSTKDFSVVYEWLRRKQAQGVERGWKEQEL